MTSYSILRDGSVRFMEDKGKGVIANMLGIRDRRANIEKLVMLVDRICKEKIKQ